ncbi:MAG: hypothetical protein PHH80_10865, partial [Sphaerochaetaceae bacterium]|nr:hypothetical protein [Sphaerochaetaceae bacterium]
MFKPMSPSPIGQNDLSLPVWVASFIFIELMWTFIGSFITHYTEIGLRRVIQDTTLIAFVTLNMNFIVLLVLILLFIKFVLKTSILSFLTSHKKFIAESENYRYCLRCTPIQGDYNVYLYIYDKRQQEMARLQKVLE